MNGFSYFQKYLEIFLSTLSYASTLCVHFFFINVLQVTWLSVDPDSTFARH